MSDLLIPNLNGMSERQFKRQGLNVTKDELATELQSFAKSILDAFGPIAMLQGELMLRQQALEDHLGYVYVPKATPEAPVVSEISRGDTTSPASTAPVLSEECERIIANMPEELRAEQRVKFEEYYAALAKSQAAGEPVINPS